MKISTDTVRRLSAHVARLTGGVHGLAFAAQPGDPERFVDKLPGGKTFAGRGATRQAAAYYAGIIDACPGNNPPIADTVLSETAERNGEQIDAGRRAADRQTGRG